MAEITQTIPLVNEYTVTPSRNNPSTFFEDRETRLSEEATRIPEQNTQATAINTWTTQANSLRTEVNSSRDDAVASAAIATGAANYKGIWVAGYNTTGYSLGMSVSYGGYNYVSNINNNLVEPTALTNTTEWNYIEAVDPSSVYTKTATDVLLASKVDKVTSTDNAIVRFSGTTGQVQNSGVTIDDSGNITGGSFNGFGGSGFKNYIINGGFDVWQRGEGFTTGGYTADRFVFYAGGGSGIVSRVEKIAGSNYEKLRLNMTSGGNFEALLTRLEDVQIYASKTVTFSFKYFSDTQLNARIQFDIHYGIGGSATEYVSRDISLVSNQDGTVSVTVTLPTQAGKIIGDNSFLGVVIYPSKDTPVTYSIDFSKFQLEEGSVVTPFENRAISLEKQMCRYYYRKSATQLNVNDLAYEMRTTPTEAGTAPYTYSAEL